MSILAVLIPPTVYAIMIILLILENQRSGKNDKFPCIVVKARRNPNATEHPEKEWSIRLINIGRGPAFIKRFAVYGLTDYRDGDRTDDTDKVIGPEVGDPDLEIEFTFERDLAILRSPDVTIEIWYEDIAGREFVSGIRRGIPCWHPPKDFRESLLRRLVNFLKEKGAI